VGGHTVKFLAYRASGLRDDARGCDGSAREELERESQTAGRRMTTGDDRNVRSGRVEKAG
jgi:hypothetical protein